MNGLYHIVHNIPYFFLILVDWCAKLYRHENYKGWESIVEQTSQLDLQNGHNNRVSSVKVKPGCTLKLYKGHSNTGLLGTWTSDDTFLDGSNDQASSLSCDCQGMI